jgi:hypothetical protein
MLTELLEVLNSETTNGAWSDARLLAYLAEGQDKFCEETGFFVDITNYTLALATGTALYAIPARAIQIMNIWYGTKRLGKVLQDSVSEPDEWPVDFDDTASGMPNQWQTDQTTGFIKLAPTPTATENGLTLNLHVWRYSRYDLAGDGATTGVAATPELPARFQRACIEWAAYKAFNHHDMEAQDPVKARDHLSIFNEYVMDGRSAFRRFHNLETRIGSDPAYRT